MELTFKGLGFSLQLKHLWNDITGVAGHTSWFTRIFESFSGAWQTNVEVNRETVLAFHTVYACISLIAQDISKLNLRLVEEDDDGIWTEVRRDSPFKPVLRKPNHYQNRGKFVEWWITSKLVHGNTYALKQRDNRGVVVALYILDPMRVRPLVTPGGDVFYELSPDNLSLLGDAVTVPAREIIHDVMVPLYHPLVGVSPLYASGLPAVQGLNILNNSTKLFGNSSQPGGVITAPGAITPANAAAVKAAWDTGFGGDNFGKVAVLGDGMTYTQMGMNATDAQLIEQLKWASEMICSTFHVPSYMVNVGPPPNYNNIEALSQQYYTQCLQKLIEAMEEALDFGLGLAPNKVDGIRYGVEFDIDGLLRMDTATRVTAAAQALQAGLMVDEVRQRYHGVGKVAGGDTVYMQEQNWPLRHLAERPLPTRQLTPPADMAPPSGERAFMRGDDAYTSEDWVRAKQDARFAHQKALAA